MARGDGWSFDLRSDWMRALTAIAVFLCFAGFVIALAGVAALQHDQHPAAELEGGKSGERLLGGRGVPAPRLHHQHLALICHPARRVKLRIETTRLARLHPADIADILEELAPAERHAVFGALEENVAAQALEEVEEVNEHEVQQSPLKQSGVRTANYVIQLKLTTREREVLQLVAEGHTDREVADTLVLSPRTVNRHLSNILVKLNVSGRAAAVAYAIRNGLV